VRVRRIVKTCLVFFQVDDQLRRTRREHALEGGRPDLILADPDRRDKGVEWFLDLPLRVKISEGP